MALLFFDSFDHYATAHLPLKYSLFYRADYVTIGAYGRNGTQGMRLSSTGNPSYRPSGALRYLGANTRTLVAGAVGDTVTVTGSGFEDSQGSGSVTINGVEATIVSWSDTEIVINVPEGATTGDVVVTNDPGNIDTWGPFIVTVPAPIRATILSGGIVPIRRTGSRIIE